MGYPNPANIEKACAPMRKRNFKVDNTLNTYFIFYYFFNKYCIKDANANTITAQLKWNL